MEYKLNGWMNILKEVMLLKEIRKKVVDVRTVITEITQMINLKY